MNIIESSDLKKRKKIIFDTAQNLFKTKGYKATTMRELAEIVGIKAASLYSHIKSKEEILEFICFKLSDAFFDVQLKNQKTDKSLRADEKLKNAINAHLLVISTNLDACGVFVVEWKNLKSEPLKEFEDRINIYEKIFLDILNDGINNLVFKEVDEVFFVKTLLTTLNAIPYSQHTKNFDFEQIAEKITSIYLKGIMQ